MPQEYDATNPVRNKKALALHKDFVSISPLCAETGTSRQKSFMTEGCALFAICGA